MKRKVALTLAGIGIVASVFHVQSLHYQKRIDKLQSELADVQVQNKILQADLKECKNFQANNDKLFAEFLKDFERVNKSIKKGGN